MDKRDVIALIGIGLLAYGLWLIHPATALIALGILFIGASRKLGVRNGSHS
jgi:hypothetical protein